MADNVFDELFGSCVWVTVVLPMLCVGACLVTLFCVVSVYLFSSLGGSVIFITRCGLVLLVVLIRMIDLTEGKKRAPEGKKEEVFSFFYASPSLSFSSLWFT